MTHRWDKYREPEAKKDPNGCPQCGGKVVYRGLTDIQCQGKPDCMWYVAPPVTEGPLEEENTQPIDWANTFWSGIIP